MTIDNREAIYFLKEQTFKLNIENTPRLVESIGVFFAKKFPFDALNHVCCGWERADGRPEYIEIPCKRLLAGELFVIWKKLICLLWQTDFWLFWQGEECFYTPMGC